MRFFTLLGAIPFTFGFILGIRWLYLLAVEGAARTHLPSLILTAILILIGVQLWIFGVVADVIAVNRKLLEDIQLRIKRIEYR
jgi:hypothetical protein